MQCEPSSRHKKCHNYCGSLCTLVASSFLCVPHEQASKNGVISLSFSMTTTWGPKKRKTSLCHDRFAAKFLIPHPWAREHKRRNISFYSIPLSMTKAWAGKQTWSSMHLFLSLWRLVDQKRRKTSLCQDRRLRLTIKILFQAGGNYCCSLYFPLPSVNNGIWMKEREKRAKMTNISQICFAFWLFLWETAAP